MEKQLVLFDRKNKIEFRVIGDELGLTAEEVGRGLGYEIPRESINKIYERNKEELEAYSVEVKLTATDGKAYMTRVFLEEGVYLICMFAKTERAKEFRKWVAETLKAARHRKIQQARLETAEKMFKYAKQLRKKRHDPDFGERLLRYRKMGLTQRETAKLLDISRDTEQEHEKILKDMGVWEEPA